MSGSGRGSGSGAPLISVTIPTYNAAAVIAGCLASVAAQRYPQIEVLVVDSASTDGTPELAAQGGATVVRYDGRLLGARCEGVRRAQGEHVLLLDADQRLARSALARSLALMDRYDMLVLEERSYRPRTWLAKRFAADRALIHRVIDEHSLDPCRGTLLPRFFRRQLLRQAVAAIPPALVPVVVHHDHAILYLEAHRISTRVGFLPRGVYHREAASIVTAWNRNVRYGQSLRDLPRGGRYGDLLRRRDRGVRPASFTPANLPLGLQSVLLLTLLKTARRVGYLLGTDRDEPTDTYREVR